MSKKIKLEEITPEQLVGAAQIIRDVVRWQTEPANPKLGLQILAAILSRDPKKRVTEERLRAGLSAGLDDGLYAGLDAGLDDGLRAGLSAGLDDGLYAGLYDGLYDGLRDGLYAGLRAGLDDGLHAGLSAGLDDGLYAGLYDGLNKAPIKDVKLFYCGIFWSWWLARYLIAASWGCKLDMKKLGLLYGFCRFCPIIGTVEQDGKLAIVILPKPTVVRLEEIGTTTGAIKLPQYQLHGNGVPSVEYPGLNLYYWQNRRIPERMGKIPSSEWKPEWLLDEPNSEIRCILIQEIGYEKIAKELNGETRDKWREYSLVRFPQELDVEPIQLLTMTCPSTDKLHALRVPPDISSAEEAITWCNWGTKPGEFLYEH